MRNRSSRSFTVETKSGGRQRPIIPHRAVAPVVSRPAVSWPPPAEPQAPAAEPRRILPNLIVTEALPDEVEPAAVVEERSVKPRRGRPLKAKPVEAEIEVEPLAEPAFEVAAPAPTSQTPGPRPMHAGKQAATLPLGERWKRRLGRWAR